MYSHDIFRPARGAARAEAERLLRACGLRPEPPASETLLLYDESGDAVGTASREGRVLRHVAVDPAHAGAGACAAMLGALTASAFAEGVTRLFLATKPANAPLFSSLGFYPVFATEEAALMENRPNALARYLASLPRPAAGEGAAAVVLNANPFTRGHLYLCERAMESCDFLYVFIVEEEVSRFRGPDRLAMAQAALAPCPKARVCSGGPYMVSAATFPMYFIKDRLKAGAAEAALDARLFAEKIAPALGIQKRFVGSEPFCPTTAAYNEALSAAFGAAGLELITIGRKDGISASAVRRHLDAGEYEEAAALLPDAVYAYIRDHIG